MTEKELRHLFEAWCVNHCNYDTAYSDTTKRNYRSPSTRRAWIVWKASYDICVSATEKGTKQ